MMYPILADNQNTNRLTSQTIVKTKGTLPEYTLSAVGLVTFRWLTISGVALASPTTCAPESAGISKAMTSATAIVFTTAPLIRGCFGDKWVFVKVS